MPFQAGIKQIQGSNNWKKCKKRGLSQGALPLIKKKKMHYETGKFIGWSDKKKKNEGNIFLASTAFIERAPSAPSLLLHLPRERQIPPILSPSTLQLKGIDVKIKAGHTEGLKTWTEVN